MKKQFAVLMAIVVLASNIGSTISFAAATNDISNQTVVTPAAKEEALTSFNDMQDRITNSMTIENGKYNYDSQTIKEIVDSYDFATLKACTGIDFTNESFFNTAISLINNCNVENLRISYKSPDKYNVNATIREWNQTTIWMDWQHSRNKEQQLLQLKNALTGETSTTLGEILSQGIDFAELRVVLEDSLNALSSLVSVELSYMATCCESAYRGLMEANVKPYGTVLRVNRFTFFMNTWSQIDFPYPG